MPAKIPVILDTDIGSDIDDTWALAMLLNCPELKPLLVTTCTGDTRYRAKIVCKLLELAGRTDLPVGVGLQKLMDPLHKTQSSWVEDYTLDHYRGKLYANGVGALVHALMENPEPVTLICIGPLTNIAAALEIEPRIAARTRFVGMHGSLFRNHLGREGAIAEYNVVADVAAAQKVFAAPWKEIVITPLDTCGRVQLKGDPYQTVRHSPEKTLAAVLENYRLWLHRGKDFDTQSSILFDTVAVHLAYSEQFLKMEDLRIKITSDGFTRVDSANVSAGAPVGVKMRVAVDWQDLSAFEADLIDRLQHPRM